MEEIFLTCIGDDNNDITWWQMSVRAFVVFFVALLLVRTGGMRALGKKTAFDVLLNILLGAVLSRAITGSSPFFPTIMASMVLVLMHKVLSRLTFFNEKLGKLLKGESELLYKDGKIIWENMKKNDISENDLMVGVRECGTGSLDDIEEIYFERSGKISVIQKKNK